MIKQIAILSLIAVSTFGAGSSIQVVPVIPTITVRPNAASPTYGIQEALNNVNNSSTGVVNVVAGSISLQLEAGVYLCSTQIVVPAISNVPLVVKMEGKGMTATTLYYTGPTNNSAFYIPPVGGTSTTNYTSIFVRDMAFIYASNAPQKIVEISDHSYSRFENCLFASGDSVTNGSAGITLCVEGNANRTIPGLCGLFFERTTAGQNDIVKNCYFNGLACGIYAGSYATIQGNNFMNIGVYSTNGSGTAPYGLLFNKSLWTGTYANGEDLKALMSLGAAIVAVSSDRGIVINGNNFFCCGAAIATSEADYSGIVWTDISENYYTLCQYRLLHFGDKWWTMRGIVREIGNAPTAVGVLFSNLDSGITDNGSTMSPNGVNPGGLQEIRMGPTNEFAFIGSPIRAKNGLISHGTYFSTNYDVWPSSPVVYGSTYIGNSNGNLYILRSTNGAGVATNRWTSTNKF